WQLKDGAWLETFSARGPTPVVILPAELRVGTRWAWTYTDGLGTTGTHRFRILDLDASVTLPSGKTMDHCLKVEEIRPDLGPHAPNTHWFAPGIGRVATRLDAGIWWRALRSFTP
ncbi:MAG: hypothetical protein KC731_31905, partial [Myxococcales bacterium]|nr:hypothetical protein [Myxococcales bacterium]